MPLFEQIDHAGVTDVGIRRSHNQDAYSIQQAVDHEQWMKVGHVFLVADGMGGHAVGEKASAKAVREIPLIYVKHVHDGPMAALRRAFQETNAGINAVGQENPEFRGLGTTATALVLREEGAWVAHVGDSRVYRIRDGQIEQISFDHSYAWEMARRLNIPPEDLPDVKKNVIIRSLGPDPLVQVDIEGPYPLSAGDVFVLCSDGLSNLVAPEEIGTVASTLSPKEAATFLVELANLRGGPDNITVIVVRVGLGEPTLVPGRERSAIWRFIRTTTLAWNRRVPWPLTILGIGFLFAAAFVSSVMNEGNEATLLFTFALLFVSGGLVGLWLHARREKREAEKTPDRPKRLNVYREFDCRIQQGLVEKLQKMAAHLKQHMEGGDWNVDWARYAEISSSAEACLLEGDLLTAFREQCRALISLAAPYNLSRHKDEGFRPKFDDPAA